VPACPGLHAQEPDTSTHTAQFVTVEKDARLEVLDWGGSGRPLVLLQGLGDTAHVFDRFAPKPSSRVVRLPHANHCVFRSNEADVRRKMKAFIDGLAK